MGAVRRATDNAIDNCLVVAQHAHSEHGPLVAPHVIKQNASNLMAPALSVMRSRSGAGVQSGRMKKLRPDQGVVKDRHQWMSKRKLSSSAITLRRRGTEVLQSISLLRKVRPAGTTFSAKLRVAISDRSSRLVHWVRLVHRLRESLGVL